MSVKLFNTKVPSRASPGKQAGGAGAKADKQSRERSANVPAGWPCGTPGGSNSVHEDGQRCGLAVMDWQTFGPVCDEPWNSIVGN